MPTASAWPGTDAKALECFRKGAEQGFPRAQFLLGEAYTPGPGRGAERQPRRPSGISPPPGWGIRRPRRSWGAAWSSAPACPRASSRRSSGIRRRAEQGNAAGPVLPGLSAMRAARGWSRAGRRRCGGTGPPRTRAIPGRQCNLAWCYEYGKGVTRGLRPRRPASTEQAAEQGYPRGQLCTGLCCERGRGVPLDPAAAAEWYRKAADQGEEDAQCCLGFLLRERPGAWSRAGRRRCGGTAPPRSRGCPGPSATWPGAMSMAEASRRTLAAAAEWYRRAADQGDPRGLFCRGPLL